MTPAFYINLGALRIQNILRKLKIATMRTLEQKISDAGPYNQRVEPLHLTAARKKLEDLGTVIQEHRQTGPWYRLSTTPEGEWKERLNQVEPILERMQAGKHHMAVGKTLEIAVYRALLMERPNHGLEFFGAFQGHDSSDPRDWKKIEPPNTISGESLAGGKNLDFVLVHGEAGLAGIEVKNTREWLYPDSEELHALLRKCCDLNAVPVMVCRRYAYVTFSVLNRCGIILHQNYNQLLPDSLRDLATLAQDKELLGYHDIRLGNEPNQRLRHFMQKLPRLLPEARNRFAEYKDLLEEFVSGSMRYKEFSARSRRREQGEPEDHDWPEDYD